MPSKLGKSLLIFALLVIAVISWQWIDDREVEPQATSNTIDMAENQSDYYLEDFEIINVANKRNSPENGSQGNGSLGNRSTGDGSTADSTYLKITGQSLSHHFIEGYSLIDNPTVHLRSADGSQWQASALNGTVSAGFDVLDLQNNVVLNHSQTPGRMPVTMNTNSISIDNSKRIISSDDTVKVRGQGWQYKARTMHAEIDQGTLSFTTGVEAEFANPNQR